MVKLFLSLITIFWSNEIYFDCESDRLVGTSDFSIICEMSWTEVESAECLSRLSVQLPWGTPVTSAATWKVWMTHPFSLLPLINTRLHCRHGCTRQFRNSCLHLAVTWFHCWGISPRGGVVKCWVTLPGVVLSYRLFSTSLLSVSNQNCKRLSNYEYLSFIHSTILVAMPEQYSHLTAFLITVFYDFSCQYCRICRSRIIQLLFVIPTAANQSFWLHRSNAVFVFAFTSCNETFDRALIYRVLTRVKIQYVNYRSLSINGFVLRYTMFVIVQGKSVATIFE